MAHLTRAGNLETPDKAAASPSTSSSATSFPRDRRTLLCLEQTDYPNSVIVGSESGLLARRRQIILADRPERLALSLRGPCLWLRCRCRFVGYS